jgi:hypothetical protein
LIEVMVAAAAFPYVNLSALEVALVPKGVVTVISTIPAASIGEIAEIWVLLKTLKVVALRAPNLTAVAPVNPEPLMVTTVGKVGRPVVGEIELTTGAPDAL